MRVSQNIGGKNMENKIVAQVGERKITLEEIEQAIKYTPKEHQEALQTMEGKKNLLNQLVIQEVIYLDAIKNKYDQEEAFINDLEKLKVARLKEYGINKILSDVEITEEEIRVFYDGNQNQFKTEESANAKHILVATKEEAEEVLKELKEGKEFEKMAGKYSTCPSKSSGGDLGFFTRGKMVPEFEDAAFKLEPGELSEPVETQFGYHIIKLIEKKEPGILEYKQVRDQISEYLIGQKRNVQFFQKTEVLKEQYEINTNEELLKEL